MRKKFLIIKGDAFQAARAAADMGVPFVFEREIRRGKHVETTGYTTASEYVLNQWFVETIQSPFPVGTLLFWDYVRE